MHRCCSYVRNSICDTNLEKHEEETQIRLYIDYLTFVHFVFGNHVIHFGSYVKKASAKKVSNLLLS